MRLSVLSISLVLLAKNAHADDKAYFAASTEALAGAGFEGLNVTAVGLEASSGLRFARFFAVDLFFEGLVDTQPYRLPSEGAACSGNYTEQFHWEALGLRFWARPVHSRHVDFSIAAPYVAGGVAFTHGKPFQTPPAFCAQSVRPLDWHGALAVFHLITFALELRFDDHFAWRFMAGAEIDLAVDADLGILSISASAGPVFRF